jgi:uridine phosphorylase
VTYPRVSRKHALPAAVSPAEHAEYVRATCNGSEPVSVTKAVMLYQNAVLQRTLTRLPGQQKEGWISGDLWMVHADSGPIAVCGRFGKGAPAAGLVLEQLAALGASKVISIGTAGSLARHLEIGDTVVCDRAIRDEGLSYHYLPDSKYCTPSETLTTLLCERLRADNENFYSGTSWSTDAPYRETAYEADLYRSENVLTVDMEAAGVFAVGQFRDVQVAAAFGITDLVCERGRERRVIDRRCSPALDRLVEAAVHAL